MSVENKNQEPYNRCPIKAYRKRVGEIVGLTESQVATVLDAIALATMELFEEGYTVIKVLPFMEIKKVENKSREIKLNGKVISSRNYFKIKASILEPYRKYGDACNRIIGE